MASRKAAAVDSYQQGNQGNQGNPKQQQQPQQQAPARTGGTGRLGGTGMLNNGVDAFKPSGTGMLNPNGGTKRLGTGPIDPEKQLGSLHTEIENGELIISKLQGRIAVLQRALGLIERPNEAMRLFAGVSAGEANFTKQVVAALQPDPNNLRRVQVACYQFDQALKGLTQAKEALAMADRYEGAQRAQYIEQYCQVEKLRGQIYPLINLHVVFKDHPLIAQLIPAPKAPTPGELPPPPPPIPAAEQQAAQASPRGTGILAEDPAVQQMVETLNRVTGNLKDKFLGAFNKKK